MNKSYQEKYKGERLFNKFDGLGELELDDGSVYKGTFLKGNFHGEGVLLFQDGSRLEGSWDHGKLVKKQYFFKDDL